MGNKKCIHNFWLNYNSEDIPSETELDLFILTLFNDAVSTELSI
jgi:hypothetical protein